jgi:hypothetical protein
MLSSLKLGQTLVIAGDGTDFLSLSKQALNFLQKAAEAKKKLEEAKKSVQDGLGEKRYDEQDQILTEQQFAESRAKQTLDKAWKAYKADKSMKRFVDLSSKKDLQEKLLDLNFKKLLENHGAP